MSRRRVWVVGAAAALAGLAAAGAYLGRPYPPGPGVRWDNVGRIRVGMTPPEVEAIIGSPPQAVWPGDPIDRAPPGPRAALLWSGAECDIWVYVDEGGRVVGWEGVGRPPPSWCDRLLQRLGG